MKKLDLDHWPPLISIVLLVVCSGLLWAEYRSANDSDSGEALGRVMEARGTLQRKEADAMIFRDTHTNGRLRSGDTLRTSHSSRAVIQLNSGIKITLGEFSMVQLTSSRERLDLNLGRGSIRVRSGGRALRVRSQASGVDMQNGELNLKRQRGSKLRIEVRKGEAELSAGGRTHVLKENQLAEIKGKGIGIRTMRFRSVSPEDGAAIFMADARKKTRFAWKDTDKGSTVLEIARDSDFKNIAALVRGGKGEASPALSPGAYYWRVRAGDVKSEIRFLLIRALRAPGLLKPASGATFRRVAGPPRVDFAWVPGTTPADYTLEIAGNSDFREILHSLKCRTTSLSLNLEPGIYYWRVRARLRRNNLNAKTRAPAEGITSGARSFRVRAEKQYARPIPLAPGRDAKVSAGTARSAGILFSWRGSGAIKRWEWSLAADAAFTTRVQSAGAERAYALLKGPLHEGISYWRVRGFDAKGRATPYSLPVRIRVVEAPALTLLNPPKGSSIAASSILFRWRTGGTGSAYRFLLARNPDLKTPLVSRLMYGRGLDLKTPAPGRYYWRVDLVRNGRVTAKGPARDFIIPKAPDAPRMVFPAPGVSVDMSYRDKLDFRWRPVKGAFRYRVRLYQFKGGKRIRVLNTLTSRVSFSLRDLSRLDIGEFAWSVTAMDRGGRESKEEVVKFRVDLKNRPTIPRIKASGAEVK